MLFVICVLQVGRVIMSKPCIHLLWIKRQTECDGYCCKLCTK